MKTRLDLRKMRSRLAERKKILAEQVEVESRKFLPATDAGQDVADLAYDYEYRSHQAARLSKLENQITEVERALQRINDGAYGVCTNCGKAINPERLRALPYAEFCIDCQRILSAV